jgi:hypothetical protein
MLKPQTQLEIEERLQDIDMSPAMMEGPPSKAQHHLPKHGKGSHEHIIVHHDYHDHAHDLIAVQRPEEQHPARGGVTTPFPLKLHAMLDGVKVEGYEDVVSWQPHGRCFVVHKPAEFVALLPRYFKLSKLASFQRQLNLYGFQRLTKGRDRGGYYHELFLRGKPYLAHDIQRLKVKGTGVRARANPEEEPNFWSMEWMEDDEGNSIIRTSPLHVQDLKVLRHAEVAYPAVSTNKAPTSFVYPGSVPRPTMLTSNYAPIVSPTSVRRSNIAPSTIASHEDDVVCAFDRTFHYLDPFQPFSLQDAKLQDASKETPADVPSSAADAEAEAETFFKDFELPDYIGLGIEDDTVFGEMLASLIA